MTKTELLKLLREADADSCYDAVAHAAELVWPTVAGNEETLAAFGAVIGIAEDLGNPDLLLGVALMMVPEGWNVQIFENDDGAKARLRRRSPYELICPMEGHEDGDRLVFCAAIALAIAAVEAMP